MANSSGRRPPVTLFDLLILLSIAAVLLAVAIPGYQRSGFVKEASRVKRELEAVERAVEKAAEEHGIAPGETVAFERYGAYIEKPESLAKEGVDALGNAFGPQVVGERPKVPPKTAFHFEGIIDEGFWDPYQVGVTVPE